MQKKKNRVKFEIGYPVFFDGHKFDIVALQGPNVVIYSPYHKSDSAIVVPRHKVEPIAEALFDIGDEVRSMYVFRGRVVGFEPKDNRVVCVTLNENNPERGRVRYAYKPTEIVKVPKEGIFKINIPCYIKFPEEHFYRKVRPLPHEDGSDLIILYEVSTGIRLIALPMEITEEDLLADFQLEYREN